VTTWELEDIRDDLPSFVVVRKRQKQKHEIFNHKSKKINVHCFV
jgi:hypothetical protein